MRKVWFIGLMLTLISSALVFGSSANEASVRGDYVEVRTASVFAGACHYNGELVTTGRDAMLAWTVAAGKWRGVDLKGVRVLAIVSANANLSDARAARKSELVVDSAATEAQAQAISDAIQTKYASSLLGEVVKVRRAPVSFTHEGRTYAVRAGGLAEVKVEAMPNDECCKMPNLVWYAPLVPLANRKVGFTQEALYAGGDVSDAWQRAGENSAFYGNFSF